MVYDADRFESFLQLLPHSTDAALELARRHAQRLEGRSWLGPIDDQPMRHAFEIRHASFATPAFIDQLRRHRVSLVVADTAGKWPLLEDVTADFVYVRLHGDKELYASGYGQAALQDWARRIDAWRGGGQVADARVVVARQPSRKRRDVYCYFDNDVKVHAPYDARSLAAMLGAQNDQRVPERAPDADQLPPPRLRAPRMTRGASKQSSKQSREQPKEAQKERRRAT